MTCVLIGWSTILRNNILWSHIHGTWVLLNGFRGTTACKSQCYQPFPNLKSICLKTEDDDHPISIRMTCCHWSELQTSLFFVVEITTAIEKLLKFFRMLSGHRSHILVENLSPIEDEMSTVTLCMNAKLHSLTTLGIYKMYLKEYWISGKITRPSTKELQLLSSICHEM